jgi:hypothetical protein
MGDEFSTQGGWGRLALRAKATHAVRLLGQVYRAVCIPTLRDATAKDGAPELLCEVQSLGCVTRLVRFVS